MGSFAIATFGWLWAKVRAPMIHVFSDFSLLASIPADSWGEAVVEVLINSFFAAVPLLLGVAYYLSFEHRALHESLLAVVQQGELALMSASALGPIIYLVFRKRDARFPLSLLFALSIALLALFGAFAFLHSKVVVNSPDHRIIKLSVGIFAFTSSLTLLATAIDNAPLDVVQSKRQDEEGFTKKFDAKHGGQQ